MLIENFTSDGVDVEFAGNLAIYGSKINDNSFGGLLVDNVLASVYVRNTSFDHSSEGTGVVVGAGSVTVTDSSAMNNDTGFFVTNGGTLTLLNVRVISNNEGLVSEFGGALYFANCVMANNATAYQIAGGGIMGTTNPGTSFIAPGQGTSGTPTTTSLQ